MCYPKNKLIHNCCKFQSDVIQRSRLGQKLLDQPSYLHSDEQITFIISLEMRVYENLNAPAWLTITLMYKLCIRNQTDLTVYVHTSSVNVLLG